MAEKIEFSENFESESGLKGTWQKYHWSILLIGLGSVLLIIGAASGLSSQKEPEIQILPASEEPAGKIVTQLEGAVVKPGVYELSGGARVNDLLISAGGLAAEADRDWVKVNLNLAQRLTDGVKIYIPTRGEVQKFGGPGQSTSDLVAGASSLQSGLININSAAEGELDSLPGVGSVRAQAIIKNRPYNSVEELSSKKVVPQSVFEKIKDKITVY